MDLIFHSSRFILHVRQNLQGRHKGQDLFDLFLFFFIGLIDLLGGMFSECILFGLFLNLIEVISLVFC